MSLFFNFLNQKKKLTFFLLFFTLIQVIATLGVPMLIAEMIDKGVLTSELPVIWETGLKMLAVSTIGGLGAIFGSAISSRLATEYGYETRKRIFHKVQEFSVNDTDKIGISSLLTRMMNDVDNIQVNIVSFCQLVLPTPLMILVSIVMTYSVSPNMTWIPIVIMVFYVILIAVTLKKGAVLSQVIQSNLDKATSVLRELFTGTKIIRAFGKQDFEMKRTNNFFDIYAKSVVKVNRLFASLTPLAYLFLGFSVSLVLYMGGMDVASGQFEIGNLTAVAAYTQQLIWALTTTAMVIVTIPRAITSLNRISEIILKTPEVKDTPTLELPPTYLNPIVQFNQVGFSYSKNEESPVLDNITFKINKGETLAIVGGTGSGKSTLMKLLLRFSDVTSGNIEFNGRAITKITQESLRERISYVPQKAYLFHGTIESNLKMGDEQADSTTLEKAARIAQASDFIESSEQGYQTEVSPGGMNFSGGQRQRLAIARALVKKADVYIFDDSFSALDYKTDANVRRALKNEMKEATTIIVAQRLSTVMAADTIIIIDNGNIVGSGTHKQLLENNKVYREFASSQNLLEEEDLKDSD